jgi:hypothetical protein
MPAASLSGLARKAVVCALVLSLSGCCFRACNRPLESTVQVPLRIEEVRRQHRAPDVMVTIDRLESGGGGPACGHSAACLVLLPFVLVQFLARERVDKVTVTRDGVKTMEALYGDDGRLLSAQLFEPDGHRVVSRLELPSLGRDVIVERARVRQLPDGGTETTPLSILAQLDLEPEYRKKWADGPIYEKGAMLAEAFTMLDGEMDPFVLGELRAPTLDAQVRAHAVWGLCFKSPHPRMETFLEAALSQRAPEAALNALDCKELSEGVRAKAAVEALPAYCAAERASYFESALQLLGKEPAATPELLPADCPPERAAFLRLARGLEPEADDDERMVRALADDFYAGATDKFVSETNPRHRVWILEAMKRGRTGDLLKMLKKSKQAMSASELRLYLEAAKALPANGAGNKMRVQLLAYLRSGAHPGVGDDLEALAQGELREEALLALAARGDDRGRREVARALVPGQDVPRTTLMLSKKEVLAAYVLVMGGCDEELLRLALKKGAEDVVDEACRW